MDDVRKGLSQKQVAQRYKAFGPNEIQHDNSRSAWVVLAEQFKSPLVIILIFACFSSLFLNQEMEAFAIGAILIINAIIGFFQEYRAETAIAALKDITAPRAKVVREGRPCVILAREVVPGDLLMVEAGDVVAADAVIFESSRLQLNESVLTGESSPVLKVNSSTKQKPADSVYSDEHLFMGTSVVTGTAIAQVTATGMKSELGKIAHLISTAHAEKTPLQVQLAGLGKVLLYITILVVALVAALGLAKGMTWIDLFIFSVSLAVAAVPEGLPAIVTVALARGVQRLAKQNALVRRLPSVETLGNVSVICTDKTGTLTTGEMRVRDFWTKNFVALIKAAASCCDAELDEQGISGTGDPTEIAILASAFEHGIYKDQIERENPRLVTEPFDSGLRKMSILRRDGIYYVKGAVESLLPLCHLDPVNKVEMLEALENMSSSGLRVLAVASGVQEGDFIFHGLLGLADPPRKESVRAIKEARAAGITPIMITGDHPKTAEAIASEIGLVRDGESFKSRVFARANPEDKLKLVRYWKDQGAIVAMTGDGVNDAPALREAHIGIAMGKTGTEVTRQSADLIIADDNFATIVTAVREGRGIFQNIRKAITYLLTGNLAEIVLVLGSTALDLPLPLLAPHLLWINLVTDALPAMTLIMEPLAPSLMKSPPRPATEQILGLSEWLRIGLIGLLEASISLGLYWHLLKTGDAERARNLIFSLIVFSQLLRAFGARSQSRAFWQLGWLSNVWLLVVVVFTVILQMSLHYFAGSRAIFDLSPLSTDDLMIILPLAFIPLAVIELKKFIVKLGQDNKESRKQSELSE